MSLDQAQLRTANYYAELLGELSRSFLAGGDVARQALHHFDQDIDQVRSIYHWIAASVGCNKEWAGLALRFSDCVDLLRQRMPFREVVTWQILGLRASKTLASYTSEAAVLGNMGVIYLDAGEVRRATRLHARSLRFAIAAGDRMIAAEQWCGLSSCYIIGGAYPQALAALEEAAMLHRLCGNKAGLATVKGNMGIVSSRLGRPAEAIGLFLEAISETKRLHNARDEALWLHHLAHVYSITGDNRRALQCERRRLRVLRSFGGHVGGVSSLPHAATEHLHGADVPKGLTLLEDELLRERARGPAAIGEDLLRIGTSHAAYQRPEVAAKYIQRAEELIRRTSQDSLLPELLEAHATLHWNREDRDKAIDSLEKACGIAKEQGNISAAVQSLSHLVFRPY